MVSYNFKPAFADAVESGDKRLTLRRPRQAPARHARVGDVVSLWTGQRTAQARRLGLGVCVLRAEVLLSATGLERVYAHVAAPENDPLCRRFELWLDVSRPRVWADDFARADGFANWAQAWAWHAEQAALPHPARGSLVRELVGWEKVAAAHEGALLADPALESAA